MNSVINLALQWLSVMAITHSQALHPEPQVWVRCASSVRHQPPSPLTPVAALITLHDHCQLAVLSAHIDGEQLGGRTQVLVSTLFPILAHGRYPTTKRLNK